MADEHAQKWASQLRKGSLELIILAALRERSLYGLELLNTLQQLPTTAISEGTLYPLMDRLKRSGLVEAQWQQNGDTKPRKYYALTPVGHNKLNQMTGLWRQSVEDIEWLLAHPGPSSLPKRGNSHD